jgi:hypothetical protein
MNTFNSRRRRFVLTRPQLEWGLPLQVRVGGVPPPSHASRVVVLTLQDLVDRDSFDVSGAGKDRFGLAYVLITILFNCRPELPPLGLEAAIAHRPISSLRSFPAQALAYVTVTFQVKPVRRHWKRD